MIKSIVFTLSTIFVLSGSPLIAQGLILLSDQDHAYPWEASVSVVYIYTDITGELRAMSDVNAQLATSGLTQIATNPRINMVGASVSIQKNIKTYLSAQAEMTGGFWSRIIPVPVADVTALGASTLNTNPLIISGGVGPLLTLRNDPTIQPWVHVLAGVAYTDSGPDAKYLSTIMTNDKAFSATATGLSLQGGVGVDLCSRRQMAVRLAIDDINTWLYSSRQSQIRASVGLVWRFGRAHYDY